MRSDRGSVVRQDRSLDKGGGKYGEKPLLLGHNHRLWFEAPSPLVESRPVSCPAGMTRIAVPPDRPPGGPPRCCSPQCVRLAEADKIEITP
jgi:hypothetical protein